jgi:FkbM family methyltransferase
MMSTWIKNLVDVLGFSVKRKQFRWEQLNTCRVEHFALDGLVHSRLMLRGSLSVVQVGAFDGISNNALDYIKLANICELQAVLIEPNPVAYNKLVSNFSDLASVIPVNVAIDIADGKRSFTVVGPHKLAEFQWIEQLSSFDKQTILSHSHIVPDLTSYMVDVSVDCLALSTVLSTNGIDCLDVLLVDTEGYDAVIVEHALQLKVQPGIVLFEHTHLNKTEILRVVDLLRVTGYSITDIGQDFLCWKQFE